MGAYHFARQMLADRLDLEVPYVGRNENASPAVASFKMHVQEQHKIMIDAIGLPTTHEDAGRQETEKRRETRRAS